MESPLPRLPSLDLGRFKVAIAFEGGRSEVAIAFKGKTYMWSIRVPSIRCRSITHRFVCMYTTGAPRVLSQDCRQDCITLLSVIELIESSNQIFKFKFGRLIYDSVSSV